MKEQQFIIGIVVGYMLKVMKSYKKEIKFKEKFACIRHGNFPKFISLVNGSIPEMVVSKAGNIEVNPSPKKDNLDYIGLLMSGPSLKLFYSKCVNEYGAFQDETISDKIYYQIALYEVTLRIHANNFKTLNEEDSLQTIISNLGGYLELSKVEIITIQNGRKLLNMIKHGKKNNYSWSEGLLDFEKAYKLMAEREITLE